MTISIIKVVAVILILAMMVLLLLSVNHMVRGDFNSHQDEIDRMRRQVDERDEVISEDSIFREIVQVKEKPVANPQPHSRPN